MTLDELKQKLAQLDAKGFIPSRRKGPTGIGYTLEEELGIKENNIPLPDLGNVELKAHRSNTSGGLITLFTFNKEVWNMPPLDAIKAYGSPNPKKNGRLGLYYTMSHTPNSAGLFLFIENEAISVKHTDGTIIATWHLETLAQRFLKKIPALIFVNALTEKRDGKEYFHYNRARLMRETSTYIMKKSFAEEKIVLDLRLHAKKTSARNHGTGFRIYEKNFPHLFKNITEL